MALISRLSSWLERVFDMSEGDDAFEEEGAEGFLMTAVKEAPPVLPQLQPRPEEEPIAEPPTFRPPAARSDPQAEAAAETAAPAPAARDEDHELRYEATEADENVRVDTALEAPTAVEPEEAEEQGSLDVVQSVPATDPVDAEPETAVVQAESTDDAMSMFRSTTTATEFQDLTKDIDDVPALELLTEAREIRDLLMPAGSNTDNAA